MAEYSFDPLTDNSAQVNIRWEKVRVPFTVEVKGRRCLNPGESARAAVAAAKPDDWRTPLQAGNYALQNKDTDDATRWFDQSLKVLDESIKAKETFQNLSAKAQVLLAAGRKDEALAVAEKAIERATADKVDTAAFEKRVADIKAGKIVDLGVRRLDAALPS
jgi:tetratricopeptide (TPR) repeat protein